VVPARDVEAEDSHPDGEGDENDEGDAEQQAVDDDRYGSPLVRLALVIVQRLTTMRYLQPVHGMK